MARVDDKQLKGALIIMGMLWFLLFFLAAHDFAITKEYNEVVEKYNDCAEKSNTLKVGQGNEYIILPPPPSNKADGLDSVG